jgi:protein SCO1/2
MKTALYSVFLALLALTFACKSKAHQERYPFHGVIISADMRAHQALIKHEDVPGLMKGMTMPFIIHDEKVLAALKSGDIIQATLVKEEYEAWLEDIKVTGSDPAYAEKPATSSTPHRPKPGEAVPDFIFVNQNGKHIHFSQLRGSPVLLTFIYARCPLPDFCPRMNANLLTIAQQAAKEAKDPHLQLLSISFDPEHDTPDMLHNYARQWTDDLPSALRARWQFVVPPQAELKDVLQFFAMEADPDEGWISHTLSTALVGADGKIIEWYGGNQWTPDDVLKDLTAAVASTATSKSGS